METLGATNLEWGKVLDKQRTFAIICGASGWPRLANFRDARAYTQSAEGLKDYFEDASGLGLPSSNLCWLFDSEERSTDLLDEMTTFIRDRLDSVGSSRGERVVILFAYVGHGAFFGSSNEYCLLVRDTHAPIEAESSLRVSTLSRVLKNTAPVSSRVLFLDCCFAAEAAKHFQGGLEQAVSAKLNDMVKEDVTDRGVALLCAASANDPARLEHESSYTLFGRELIKALRMGDPSVSGALSLRDIIKLIHTGLSRSGVENFPKPELHTPDQSSGDLAAVRLFPNAAALLGGGILFEMMNASKDQRYWIRSGSLRLVESLLQDDYGRPYAVDILLDLVVDTDLTVARDARDLWFQADLGDLPTTVADNAFRDAGTDAGTAVVGIDFGTTNSAIGTISARGFEAITNSQGEIYTPSVISLSDGGMTIGAAAVSRSLRFPASTVRSVKLKLGTDWSVRENGRSYTAEDLVAHLLRGLVSDAERHFGGSLYGAVLTAPAYFDEVQRQSLLTAATAAGLNVLRILNEPTAAAIAYGLGRGEPERVLVVDLGGGTLDVSLIEIGDGVCEVLATDGDTNLGGDNWDNRIVEHLLDLIRRRFDLDLSDDHVALARLKAAAETAKIELSSVNQTDIRVPHVGLRGSEPVSLETTLSRETFEDLTYTLLERCREPIRHVLGVYSYIRGGEPGAVMNDVERIILVGGPTRMPALVRYFDEMAPGKPLYRRLLSDGVVKGAAIQAGILTGSVRQALLLDASTRSLGIETQGGVFTPLIRRHQTVPIQRSRVFVRTQAGQSTISIHVAEGENEAILRTKPLAVIELFDVATDSAGVGGVRVTFDLDASSILTVQVKDLDSGIEKNVRITATSIRQAKARLANGKSLSVPALKSEPEVVTGETSG